MRWVLSHPDGLTSLALSLDLPLTLDTRGLARLIAEHYFRTCIAAAISRAVPCVLIEITHWSLSDLPDVQPAADLAGLSFRGELPLSLSPCVAMHTGHKDGWGTRRMHFGGAPNDFEHRRIMTDTGASRMHTIIRAINAATVGGLPGNRATAIVVHPGASSGDEGAPPHATWRAVTEWTVCSHLEKAPSWP